MPSELTPMMRQYLKMKEENPGCLLFFCALSARGLSADLKENRIRGRGKGSYREFAISVPRMSPLLHPSGFGRREIR